MATEARSYPYLPARGGIWREIVRAVARDCPGVGCVVELGAGYCDFINQFPAAKKICFEMNPAMQKHAAPEVDFRLGDATALSGIEDGSVDLVFASNFFEHLDSRQLAAIMPIVRRMLSPGGRLVLLQPNYRLCRRHYFDDETHRTIFCDQTIGPFLTGHGLFALKIVPGFVPFSLKSRLPKWPILVRLYLSLPYRPLAAQMYVIATRS